MERWLPIPGYDGAYEVSDYGRVRSLERLDARGKRRRERLLQPGRVPCGHLTVALYGGAERRDFRVHDLVLSTFVGPRPPGQEACHWNDVPGDNRLDNLRWDTRSANSLDRVRNGVHPMANRTHCPSGHAYTLENTYVNPNGERSCRKCRRRWRAESRARKAA